MSALFKQFLAFARRYPLVVVSSTLFVVLSVVNYFLWQQRDEITQQHDGVRRNGEAMLAALSGQSRITSDLAAVQEALKMIDRNLIAEGDLAENLGYFYQMETQCHVRLSQMNQLSSLPPPEGSPYKSIPFSLRVSGTYAQIMSFVRQLEAGPRLLRIKSYSFTRGADAKNNTLELVLLVEILGNS
jgi:Tfp pilus assembly protein PilO